MNSVAGFAMGCLLSVAVAGCGAQAGGADGAAGSGSDAGAPEGLAGIPAGDRFCRVEQIPSLQWTSGFERRCVVMEAPTNSPLPPLTVKTQLDDYCDGFYGGLVTRSCSRDDVVAYCTGGPAPPGASATVLVYRSSFTPDAEHVALNAVVHCPLATIRQPDGQIIARACRGTVSAKVDGRMVAFGTRTLECRYKTDGTRSSYYVSAFNADNSHLMLAITSEGGVQAFESGDRGYMGVGYIEGAVFYVFPTESTPRTLSVTQFAERGAGLKASFSGELHAGNFHLAGGPLQLANMVRTFTEGTIDVQLAAP